MPKLRPATSTDWPAIEALLLASKLPLDGARQHLGANLVAEAGDAEVGTAGIEVCGDLGLLRSVAVSPDKQILPVLAKGNPADCTTSTVWRQHQ